MRVSEFMGERGHTELGVALCREDGNPEAREWWGRGRGFGAKEESEP